MEEKSIEKAISKREDWESGSLGKSEEFLEFKNEDPKKETIFNFIFKIERSSTSLVINDSLRQKLLERNITPVEVGECLDNRNTQFAIDSRDTNTKNQTLWFIGETKKSRKLKLILFKHDNNYVVVNAYEPSDLEDNIYCQAPAI